MLFNYAECRVLFIIMQNVIILNVIVLSVVMLNIIMLSVVMLGVIAPLKVLVLIL